MARSEPDALEGNYNPPREKKESNCNSKTEKKNHKLLTCNQKNESAAIWMDEQQSQQNHNLKVSKT